jgi:hypothetical protein
MFYPLLPLPAIVDHLGACSLPPFLASETHRSIQNIKAIAAILRANVRKTIAGFIPVVSRASQKS